MDSIFILLTNILKSLYNVMMISAIDIFSHNYFLFVAVRLMSALQHVNSQNYLCYSWVICEIFRWFIILLPYMKWPLNNKNGYIITTCSYYLDWIKFVNALELISTCLCVVSVWKYLPVEVFEPVKECKWKLLLLSYFFLTFILSIENILL